MEERHNQTPKASDPNYKVTVTIEPLDGSPGITMTYLKVTELKRTDIPLYDVPASDILPTVWRDTPMFTIRGVRFSLSGLALPDEETDTTRTMEVKHAQRKGWKDGAFVSQHESDSRDES
jgi:hypothetical protein